MHHNLCTLPLYTGINIHKLCSVTHPKIKQTNKKNTHIHLLQYHVVLLERAVHGTLMQELDPTCVWQLWHPTNTVYWDFIHWLYSRFCGPSQFPVRKHWCLPSLKTVAQMATHFLLSEVILTWGLSKRQSSSKCHSTKIPLSNTLTVRWRNTRFLTVVV